MVELGKDKEVQAIMDRLKKGKQAKQNYISVWKELDEFYRGDQYKSQNIPPWVPKPVTNFIHMVITIKRAALATENPMAMLRPLSQDDAESVAQLQRIYEWVWKRIKARKSVRDAIETSKLLGTGIVQVYWDEMTGVLGGTNAKYEGEIRTREIDVMNFFVDPNAYRLEEAAWCHVTEKKNRKWVEQEFGIPLKEERTDESNYGEEYKRDYYRDNNKDSDMIDFHSHYERYWNTTKVADVTPQATDPTEQMLSGQQQETDPNQEIGGWNYKVTYVAGNKKLKVIDPLEPNMYPFSVLYDFPQRQEFWGKGTGSLIIDNQKLINKVEGIIAMIGTLLQNPQKVISKRSGINPVEAMKYSFAPGHTWVTNDDPSRSIYWQPVPQIPPALINLAEMAKQNIREVVGLNEAYMGQAIGSLQTSGGVNSLIDRATMRDRDQMYDIELFVEQLTRIIIAFVTTKYTEERFVRFVEDPSKPDETMKFLEFIGTNYNNIEYDLEIDVSAVAPITQARKEANYRELLQIQGQYGFMPAVVTPQEFVKGTNMVDADKIIARMNKEEMQNKMNTLAQVAQMMEEAIRGGLPTTDVLGMAQAQLQAMESGKAPSGPNAPQPNMPHGIGSAAPIQNRQGSIGA
jgi:hypothetical protein